MSQVKDRLQTLRESKGWSKTQVAKHLGVSLSTYANWEYGFSEPDVDTLNKIATMYDISGDYLLGRSNNITKNNNEEKITQADLDSPVLSLDGTPITGKEAEDIREFARFKLLQKHLEEEKNNN